MHHTQIPGRPAGLDRRFGSGQLTALPPHPGNWYSNGVFEQPSPTIQTPGNLPLPKTTRPHMAFPLDVSPQQVKNLANVAYNGGNPSVRSPDPDTGEYVGFAPLPNHQPMFIGGKADQYGNVLHYFPMKPQ
ncbi:hypothetical protein AB0H12_30265 [Actinosynnema sp. NPDC023794]